METTPTSPEPTVAVPSPAPAAKTFVIVGLKAQNYKCLKAIHIVPNHAVIPLKGKNGSGKSTILDAIMAVFQGKKAIPERPIREGASKSEIECDMGDFVATLKISSAGGAKIQIKAKQTGQDINSPATLLANYSNPILLGPVEFVRLGETVEGRRKQAEMLRQLLGLDFAPLDLKKKQLYDERTLVNRDLETALAKLSGYPGDPSVPDQEVSIASLTEELHKISDVSESKLAAARDQNLRNQKVRDDRAEIARRITVRDESLIRIEREILVLEDSVRAKKQLWAHEKAGKEELIIQEEAILKAIANLKDEDETAIRNATIEARKPIQIKILEADEINTKVRAKKRRAELLADAEKHQLRSTQLTNAIEAIDVSKQQALAAADYPLPGLTFDDSGIILNGLPLNQASTAFQLKAALAIGFAMKPRIPVVLFRDWALLDDDSKKEVEQMTAASEGQIWAEEWDSADPAAIEIVDGMLKE